MWHRHPLCHIAALLPSPAAVVSCLLSLVCCLCLPHVTCQDPREELLKYAKLSKDDPMFLGAAYAKSQPATILQQDTLEEEQKKLNEDAKALLK